VRSEPEGDNKGEESARTALEMANLLQAIRTPL
jgi:6,7-dimethyl-8-ribityllumazine synthase